MFSSVLAITLLAVVLCTAVLAAYGVRTARHGRAPDPRLGSSPGSVLLPAFWVEAFYWALHAPGRALVRLRINPDAITYLSVAVSVCSVPLLALGRFHAAAAVVLVGAALDAMDGMVARARGKAGPSGAVLDSFVDRIADAAPYVGLAIFYREQVATLVVPLLAMVASSLVSYARAKADEHRLKLPNGLMRRHERIAYLVAALLLAPLAPRLTLTGDVAYPIVLAIVSVVGAVAICAAFILVGRTRAALRLGVASAPGLPGASPQAEAPRPAAPRRTALEGVPAEPARAAPHVP